MAGLNPNSEGIEWGGLRYAVSMDMNNFANGLNNTAMIEDDADENGVHTRRPPAGFILSIIGNLRRKSKHSPAKVVKKA